jgi:aspartyl-tRNA(Asn)/glutamyl-tRNA(Gln) amidotransferase subunit C
MALDRAEVEHIATLARIALTDAEVELLRQQLSDILEQFDVLRQLDTSGVAPTGHTLVLPGKEGAVMRDDTPADSLTSGEVLSNAPRREGEFFRVKVVLEE